MDLFLATVASIDRLIGSALCLQQNDPLNAGCNWPLTNAV